MKRKRELTHVHFHIHDLICIWINVVHFESRISAWVFQIDQRRLHRWEHKQQTCRCKGWGDWCECYSSGCTLITIVRISDFELILGHVRGLRECFVREWMTFLLYECVRRIGLRLNFCIVEWSDCSNLTRLKDRSIGQLLKSFNRQSGLTWSWIVSLWPRGTCPIIHERWPASSVACRACTKNARMSLGSGLWPESSHYYPQTLYW